MKLLQIISFRKVPLALSLVIILMGSIGYVQYKRYLVLEERVDKLDFIVSSVNKQGPMIVADKADLKYEMGTLLVKLGRYDLASSYTEETFEGVLSHKQALQSLIRQCLSQEDLQDTNTSSLFKKLISIETLEDREKLDQGLQSLLLLAIISTEMQFVGWADIQSAIMVHANRVGLSDKVLSDQLAAIAQYKIKDNL